MIKPKIFLSHSKRDKDFIIRIANDLRIARIDSWYDDWEISPGQSLRKMIFDDGIPSCDLFFVYLTENSIESNWCQKELDSAFINEFEREGGFITLFVSSDELRSKLPLDLRALRCPVLNNENYCDGLSQLISRAWETYAQKKAKELNAKNENESLKLKLENAELKLQIEKITKDMGIDSDYIITQLNGNIIENDYRELTLKELFLGINKSLATGCTYQYLEARILEILKINDDKHQFNLYNETGMHLADFIGPLIILNLVTVVPPSGEWYELYYLSDIGKKISRIILQKTA